MAKETTLEQLVLRGFMSPLNADTISRIAAEYDMTKEEWLKTKSLVNRMKVRIRERNCDILKEAMQRIHALRKKMEELRVRIRELVVPAVHNFKESVLELDAGEEFVADAPEAPELPSIPGVDPAIVAAIRKQLDAQPEMRDLLKALLQ